MSRAEFDQAKKDITLEEVAERCGVSLTPHGDGDPHVRIDCPFDCPGDHAGKREISINVQHPDKLLKCHRHGCPMRGDIVHLVHGLLTGKCPDGTVRGKDFLDAKDVIMGKHVRPSSPPAAHPPEPKETPEPPPPTVRNTPLPLSESETARALVGMESIFTTDAEQMRPKVSR